MISVASSKPSSSGICTSSRMQAKSSSRSSFSAAVARGDRDEPMPERLEDRLEREQVLLAVVDEQEARALRRSRADLGAEAVEERRDLARAAARRPRTSRRSRRRASCAAPRSTGSCTIATPPQSLILREARCAVLVRTRQHDADGALAVGRLRPTRTARRSTVVRTAPARRSTARGGRPPRARDSREARCRRGRARAASCRRGRRRSAACGPGGARSSTESSASTDRCCATTIGWCTASSRPSSSRLSACSPPQDVPITMTSYTSRDFAVDALFRVDLLVAACEAA